MIMIMLSISLKKLDLTNFSEIPTGHDNFIVEISSCNRKYYVNSFFSQTSLLWKPLLTSCSLKCDLENVTSSVYLTIL